MRRDLHACGLAQAMVERFLLSQDFDARLARLRVVYQRRCQRLAAALRAIPRLRFVPPRGGFSIWVESDLRLSGETALARALDAGVAFDPGEPFAACPSERAPLCMRLSFSAIPEARIEEAAARLAGALDVSARAAPEQREPDRGR
jgi:2-aminoadipate transaminase